MNELIYTSSQKDYFEIQGLILKRFPEAKFEDASDMIHEYRFEITLPDEVKNEFYTFAIKEGFAELGLSFGLMMLDKKGREQIKLWILKIEQESPDE